MFAHGNLRFPYDKHWSPTRFLNIAQFQDELRNIEAEYHTLKANQPLPPRDVKHNIENHCERLVSLFLRTENWQSLSRIQLDSIYPMQNPKEYLDFQNKYPVAAPLFSSKLFQDYFVNNYNFIFYK